MNAVEKVNILLVDDSHAKLMSHEAILAEVGENLLKASSARQAFEVLLKNEVALILIDVCMPDLDGFELAAMIREHPRFQTTAIIFVSAVLMTKPDQLRGYQLGGVDYVPVPVVPELLRAKVKVFVELYRKTRQLERFNAELERRVAERTADLQRFNEELEQRIDDRTRERETALAQLFEAQKMDTIGRLTGGVAHDFNNLLMAVLGSLALLEKRLGAEDQHSRRLLQNAVQGAQRGAALTQRLLAFSRLNLALNARDAMPKGGRLMIAAAAETITQSGPGSRLVPGDYLRISIVDTGVGMDNVTLTKATEPFFTTKGPGKGTGLGLSMVQGLAAQSGGMLDIHSEPDAGTTIDLWLPRAMTSAVSVTRAAQAAHLLPQTEPCRVMIVDDDLLVMTGTAAMIDDLGHTSIEAHSAAEALAKLDSGIEVDVVITDHAMPSMTGLQLAECIQDRFPGLPIILATGYAELPADPTKLGLLKLTKPCTQQEIAAAIHLALRSRGAVKVFSAPAAARR